LRCKKILGDFSGKNIFVNAGATGFEGNEFGFGYFGDDRFDASENCTIHNI